MQNGKAVLATSLVKVPINKAVNEQTDLHSLIMATIGVSSANRVFHTYRTQNQNYQIRIGQVLEGVKQVLTLTCIIRLLGPKVLLIRLIAETKISLEVTRINDGIIAIKVCSRDGTTKENTANYIEEASSQNILIKNYSPIISKDEITQSKVVEELNRLCYELVEFIRQNEDKRNEFQTIKKRITNRQLNHNVFTST